MPCGRPNLKLRVAGGSHLQESVVTAVVQLDASDHLRMTAIEAFGETKNGRERSDGSSLSAVEDGEAVVLLFRRGPTMITGDERDGFDLLGLETSEIAVLDEVVRVLVVAFVADVHPDVMQ